MKSLLKVICASLMLTLASCAHHRGGCEGQKHNCPMEKSSKECEQCCKEGKCDMKKEEKKDEAKK